MESPRRRDLNTDLIKTVAIFGVIFIHTCSAGFDRPVSSAGWISALFYGTLVRASVPLFLMCSGALLLAPERELSLKRLWLRNILRIVIAMLFWGIMYKLYHLCDTGTFSLPALWQGVKEVFLFKQEFHFYYLHIILIFYVLLPVLRVFVKNADRRALRYALAVWFALGILYPTVKPFWPFTLLGGMPQSQWALSMTYSAAGYGLLGWYLKKYPLSRRVSGGLAAFGFLFIFGGTFVMSVRQGSSYLPFLEGMSVGTAFLAAGIYGLARTVKIKDGSRSAAVVTYVSKASFCVYLIHVFFIYSFQKNGFTIDILPVIVSVPLIASANMLISSALYFPLSKLPLVNRWLI